MNSETFHHGLERYEILPTHWIGDVDSNLLNILRENREKYDNINKVKEEPEKFTHLAKKPGKSITVSSEISISSQIIMRLHLP